MSATQTIPAVVPVAPVVAVAPVAHIAPVASVALVAPVAPVAPGHRPGRGPTKAHKNADFVLESAKNGDPEGKKRTKTPIMCSGRLGLAPRREIIGIGKHNRRDAYRKRGLPANHLARFQNANTS